MKKRFWLVVTLGVSFSPVVLAKAVPLTGAFKQEIRVADRAPASKPSTVGERNKPSDFRAGEPQCDANPKAMLTFDSKGEVKQGGAKDVKAL